MSEAEIKKKLKRNIHLWGAYKIFTKRVFIPLTTIYATQQAGLNIQQIGLVASATSLISFLCDTPTGYWADKHGRKKSAQIGAALAAIGSLVYIFSINFVGIVTASLFLSVGYSFLNGSMEALIHDSLVALKQEDNYAKIASRAQSLSLVANAVIVASVPLLYPIDRRLPFVVGFIAYLILYGIASMLLEPVVEHNDSDAGQRFIHAIRLIITKKTVFFFLCVGFIYALGTGTYDVFNLATLKLGLPVKYLGLLFGSASILGAVIGLFVHHLKRLSFKQYASIDLIINLSVFIAYGVFRSLPLAIIIFIINFAWWRYEQIMYQHYVLKIYGTSRYKATIVSLMVNSRSLNEIWMSLGITTVAKQFGLLNSIGYASVLIVAFWPLLLLSISQFEANAKAKAAIVNQ